MFTNRTTRLLSLVTLIAITTLVTISADSLPHSVIVQPVPEAVERGMAIYFQSERSLYSSPNNELGLDLYHNSEWGLDAQAQNLNQDVGLAIYHQSERATYSSLDNKLGLALYHRSEWGLDGRTAEQSKEIGQAIYFTSERSITLRDLGAFNAYQRSEWFGW